MKERNRNPYGSIDWQSVIRITGNTHVHCRDNEDKFDRILKSGVDFWTLSNYYPSAPWYPLDQMTKGHYRCHHRHAVMMGERADKSNIWAPVANGKLVPGPFDWNKLISGWINEVEEPHKSELPFKEGGPAFPPLPEHILEAPNAEHHGCADLNDGFHFTSPGSFFASGTFDCRNFFHTFDHGFGCGCGYKWRDLFDGILAELQYPEGGGVIINHPVWSHLDQPTLHDMLDHDPRVLGIEALNGDCLRTNTGWSMEHWDNALKTGRQCYGFAASDHMVEENTPGRIKILAGERTARAALAAIRNGEFYCCMSGKGIQFTCIKAENGKLTVAADRPGKWKFISNKGVVKESSGTLAECPFADNLYLRAEAEDETGERIFTQATFADSLRD